MRGVCACVWCICGMSEASVYMCGVCALACVCGVFVRFVCMYVYVCVSVVFVLCVVRVCVCVWV